MRTIPEIVAQMRELIEELEHHTGKPAPKEEAVEDETPATRRRRA